MRNIFELTKREQRIVILIVTVLVVIAFARHFWRTKPADVPSPAATSAVRDSPNQLPDKSGKRP